MHSNLKGERQPLDGDGVTLGRRWGPSGRSRLWSMTKQGYAESCPRTRPVIPALAKYIEIAIPMMISLAATPVN